MVVNDWLWLVGWVVVVSCGWLIGCGWLVVVGLLWFCLLLVGLLHAFLLVDCDCLGSRGPFTTLRKYIFIFQSSTSKLSDQYTITAALTWVKTGFSQIDTRLSKTCWCSQHFSISNFTKTTVLRPTLSAKLRHGLQGAAAQDTQPDGGGGALIKNGWSYIRPI